MQVSLILFLSIIQIPDVSLLPFSYFHLLLVGVGTTAGKCNIMGYWHIGNTDPAPTYQDRYVDTQKCTDACEASVCGTEWMSASVGGVRPDFASRDPLVDFAISELPFSANDYKNFPDLRSFPAFAGTVAVYLYHYSYCSS